MKSEQIIVKPCDTITETLESMNLEPSALLLDTNKTDRLLRSEIPITPNIAKRLEQITGVSKTFWLNLQKEYDNEK